MFEALASLLPHHETSPEQRAAQLAAAQQTYRYSYKWPPDVAVAETVPDADSYSPMYIAALLPSAWEIFKNTIGLVDLVHEKDGLRGFFAQESHRIPALNAAAIGDWYMNVANDLAKYVAASTPTSLDAYNALYPSLSTPSVSASWKDDRTFAWQRLGGVNR